MSDIPPTLPALFVCPFCGGKTPDQPRCSACNGPLDPLSRQATQNSMGPWFIRDEQQPYRPGCSYDTVLMLIARGRITLDTILRGPTTFQFWYPARRVPGVAYRFGICHSCQADVSGQASTNCFNCGTELLAEPDRQFLGLMPIRHIPGQGSPASEVGQPEVQAQAISTPTLTQVVPQVQAASEPRRRAVEGRLEAEIRALRNRMGFLMAIAAGSVFVAVVAVILSLQGRSGGSQTSGGVTNSAGSGQSTTGGGGSTPSSVRVPSLEQDPLERQGSDSGMTPQTAPKSASDLETKEKDAVSSEPGTVSTELQTLRQTRWP